MIHSEALDKIQNRLPWIHDPKRFFTADPKRVKNASGNLKQFQYIQQLFNNPAHLYGHFEFEACIKRSNLSVLSGRLNRNTNRTCIVLVHNDKSRQNCNTISPARLATFYFSSRSFISTLIFKQFPWAKRPEYNERSANLQQYEQPCYSLWRIPSILWVVSLEMNENQYIVSFLNEKS